jgi:RNase H-fold protein (predicted Holliday junction resolvase)
MDDFQLKLKALDENKESKQRVMLIHRRLEGLCEIEHIKHIKDYLLPKIQATTERIDEFIHKLDEIQYCVRRFDETLSTKSNRAELFQMRGELEIGFIPRYEMEKIQERFEFLGVAF